MNQLADGLDEAGYTSEMVTKLRHHDLLTQIKLVLMGLAQIVRLAMTLACAKAFSPSQFIGEGWKVWRGPKDGNGLEGEEERDSRADNLTVVDWDQVSFDTHLEGKETVIGGEKKLARAKKSGRIQLGAKQLLSLWEDYQENGENSVLERLRKSRGITVMYFFGDVLLSQNGYRHSLYLGFNGRRWSWNCLWLGNIWYSSDPSVSLASV